MLFLPRCIWPCVATQPSIGVCAADISIVGSAQENTNVLCRTRFHSSPWHVELSLPRLTARQCHIMADGALVLSKPGPELVCSWRSVCLVRRASHGMSLDARSINAALLSPVVPQHAPCGDDQQGGS